MRSHPFARAARRFSVQRRLRGERVAETDGAEHGVKLVAVEGLGVSLRIPLLVLLLNL